VAQNQVRRSENGKEKKMTTGNTYQKSINGGAVTNRDRQMGEQSRDHHLIPARGGAIKSGKIEGKSVPERKGAKKIQKKKSGEKKSLKGISKTMGTATRKRDP